MQEYAFNQVNFAYGSLDEAFPAIDPGISPLGYRVLVQMKKPKTQTAGGIYLTGETQDVETWNTQVAKVIAVGPIAFRDRKTMEQWKEGAWAVPGDFVRVSKYGGDRFSVRDEDGTEVIFVMLEDLNLIAKVTGDPLAIKAFT